MAVKLKFKDPRIQMPSIKKFEEGWPYIPDEKIRYYVAVEEQFLFFHDHILKNLKHEDFWGDRKRARSLGASWGDKSGSS